MNPNEALNQWMREKYPQISHKSPQVPQSNTNPHETSTNLVRSDLIKKSGQIMDQTALFLTETGVRGPH